jgi:hypothetical protein
MHTQRREPAFLGHGFRAFLGVLLAQLAGGHGCNHGWARRVGVHLPQASQWTVNRPSW